jgi:3-hydroxyacyl-[acyl-carrier-protein] dehydratase
VKPVMPGVLVLEALAQATGLLAMETTPELVAPDSLYYLVGIDNARFKRPVEPGDQLVLRATLVKRKREIWVFGTEASVDGKPVATADIMCTQRVA